MKLNTLQVAEKLGVRGGAVRRLRDNGVLVDVAARKEGKKRHYSLFESTQVNDYIKEFGKGKPHRNGHSNGNGEAPVTTTSGPAVLSRIESRLSSVEDMIKQLLKVWS